MNSPNITSLDTLHAYHSSFSQGAGLGFRKVELIAPLAYFSARYKATKFIAECIDTELRIVLENVQSEEPPPPPPPPPPPSPDSPQHSPSSPSSQYRASAPSQVANTTHVATEMEQELEHESQQVADEQDEQVSSSPSPSQAASSHNAAAENESETKENESHAHDKHDSVAAALQNRFVVGRSGLFCAWHRAAYHEEGEARAAIAQVEDFPKSAAKMLAGVTDQRPKMQNYLTKECEFHMESSRKVGRSKLQSARVRAAAGLGAKSVMLMQPTTQETTYATPRSYGVCCEVQVRGLLH